MTLLLVLALLVGMLPMVSQDADREVIVEGTVLDAASGVPVPGAEVQITIPVYTPFVSGDRTLSNGVPAVRSSVTDAAGRFSLGVAPGEYYRLGARAEGYQAETYGAARGLDGVVLTSQEIASGPPIVIRLKRGSVISGNVTNADGDRVADLPVYLLRSEFHVDGNRLRMIEETTTDPEGYYAFEYLAPRRYLVAAGNPEPKMRAHVAEASEAPLRYAWTFHPGVDTPDLAAAIDLTDGSSFRSAHLGVVEMEGRRIEGNVTDTASGEPLESADVLITPVLPFAWTSEIPTGATYDPTTGRFAFDDVPDGVYRVGVNASEMLFTVGVDDWEIVEVRGRDRKGIELLAPRHTAVRGRVTLSGEASLVETYASRQSDLALATGRENRARNPLIRLDPTRPGQPGGFPTSHILLADGTFEVPNAVHGRYRLDVSGLIANQYVESARMNGVPMPDDIVEIPRGGNNVLEIELIPEGGEIRLDVPGEAPPGGRAVAVLLPDPIPQAIGYHRVERLYFGGDAIVIRGVPPGRYRLFAWDPDRPTGDPRIEDLRQRAADAVTLTVDPGRSVEAEVVLMPE